MTYDVVWVDAFTTTPLAGNACAVVLEARDLDDDRMLAIARETNLSETAYVFAGSEGADFNVRFFTPGGEIPLAGHPTIATTHALRESGRIAADRDDITLRMPAGLIPVRIVRTGPAVSYAMSQPPPVFGTTYKRGRIARALGLEKSDLHPVVLPQVVSTGTPQLMIALTSLEALDRVAVDHRGLFPRERDYFSVHLFARAGDEFALHARHFADFGGGVIEDPFTGSATGGMAGYVARYGIVTETQFRVAQGMHVHRPGTADVYVGGLPPGDIGRITVAGSAVSVMRGLLSLPN
ncbi:MAG: PhzF family phenazine biosynthesis protein [Candidatus Velthaea sp.]|jgi:trans-2,3-dihydro-3-hydroxyanthranilate isomerase